MTGSEISLMLLGPVLALGFGLVVYVATRPTFPRALQPTAGGDRSEVGRVRAKSGA